MGTTIIKHRQFRPNFLQNWLTWNSERGNSTQAPQEFQIWRLPTQLIIFPDFRAKIFKIAHPVNYSYLPPWFPWNDGQISKKKKKKKNEIPKLNLGIHHSHIIGEFRAMSAYNLHFIPPCIESGSKVLVSAISNNFVSSLWQWLSFLVNLGGYHFFFFGMGCGHKFLEGKIGVVIQFLMTKM